MTPSGKTIQGLILLAEDNGIVRMATSQFLRDAGFEVLEAGDGEAALELFEGRAGEVGAVLLDVQMPRLCGDKALERMREIRSDVPALLITGEQDSDAARVHVGPAGVGRGPTVLLPKPFRQKALLEEVLQLVGRS